jgi:hypothetical protein
MSISGAATRSRPLPALFDSGALITSAKFSTRGVPAIDHILVHCRIRIISAVKQETVDAGLVSGYPDAVVLEQRILRGSIKVVPAALPHGELESVLSQLGLQDTDRALVHTQRSLARNTRLVTDDHRLWVTTTRLGLPALFLPDLIFQLVHRNRIESALAAEILLAIRPRYATGFVELALKRLEGTV